MTASRPLFRVGCTTLGCKTNHADTAGFLGRLDPSVFTIVPFSEEADAYVVNSCTVTALADRQSRQAAYRAKRRNPSAAVIMTGCYATVGADAIRESGAADVVVARDDAGGVAGALIALAKAAGHSPAEVDHGPNFGSQTRPYLTVQEGCEAVCSYCIIPKARGPVRSEPVGRVLDALGALADRGYEEVILTGIHTGQWGRDQPGSPGFETLLSAIGEATTIGRIRISSIEPLELTDAVLEALAGYSCYCPHLHVSLQSASDDILRRMRRPYRARHVVERLAAVGKRWPEACIGVDAISGFPGETNADHAATIEFIENQPIDYVHAFTYSERPGTDAATMPDPVPHAVRKARTKALMVAGGANRRERALAQIGRELSVLVEADRDSETGLQRGFSRGWDEVLIESDTVLSGRVVAVNPVRVYNSSHKLIAKAAE